MAPTPTAWSPESPPDWASALGLVHVPLFGKGHNASEGGAFSALLDGAAASFVMATDPADPMERCKEWLSWTWSGEFRHLATIDAERGEISLRRWDQDPSEMRRFRLPSSVAGAEQFLRLLREARAPRRVSAVGFVLRAFRRLRHTFPDDDGLAAVVTLNALLLGAEGVRTSEIEHRAWDACTSATEVSHALADREQTSAVKCVLRSLDDVARSARDASLGDLCEYFLHTEERTGHALEPGLLLRHASGALYQEAHFELERGPQLTLPGMGSERQPPVSALRARRDVRYTPPTFARALAEQALQAWRYNSSSCGGMERARPLEVLDPACGSGVFLQEVLRALQSDLPAAGLVLRGFDTASTSQAVAEFCLLRARDEIGGSASVEVDIRTADALGEDWGSPDLVLMNPPFIPWQRLGPDERERLSGQLGDLAQGRPDLAMAFVWRAAGAVADGGVVGTVIPSPLFETEAGLPWRVALATSLSVDLLGRFQGFGYFAGSMVEPGFMVLHKPPSSRPERPVLFVLSRPGEEEEALRALRCPRAQPDAEVYLAEFSAVEEPSWLPRPRRDIEARRRMEGSGLPTVDGLFDVHQGARTGWNPAFILSDVEIGALPEVERRYFRPVAGNATIRQGRLLQKQYVFYPYDATGCLLAGAAVLEQEVPEYRRSFLMRHMDRLVSRKGIAAEQWWLLTREREWQHCRRPKLVSTYFGLAGSFAYDDTGDFVVVQGHAWLPRGPESSEERGEEEPQGCLQIRLALAYLALLNSRRFESLLTQYCPRVSGGQANLSTRFVARIPIPDLRDDIRVSAEVVDGLSSLGEESHRGATVDADHVDHLVARAYGLPEG